MKKLAGLILSLALMSVPAFAEDSEGRNSVTPLEICLITPLQVPFTGWEVQGLRVNTILGMSADVYGIDVGLAGLSSGSLMGITAHGVNWVKEDLYGMSAGLVDVAHGNAGGINVQGVSWTGADYLGIQVNGLFSYVGGETIGLQISSALNYANDSLTGLQCALFNYAADVKGLQVGVANLNELHSYAWQIGAFNVNHRDFDGFSNGVINYADKLLGCQVGAFNIVGDEGTGLQVGVVNAANKFTGLQLGFLNIIGNGVVPILPVLNVNF